MEWPAFEIREKKVGEGWANEMEKRNEKWLLLFLLVINPLMWR